MKIVPIVVGTIACLTAPHLHANILADLTVGAGLWQADFNGEIGESGMTTTLDELGFSDTNANVIWLNFEHILPVIPNVRLAHTDLATTASGSLTQSFQLGSTEFDADMDTWTDLDLTHTDLTLYYSPLNNWVHLDVGLTARMFDGYVEVEGDAEGEILSATSKLDGVLPMLYLNAQFDLPFSGWFVGAHGNVVSYDGDQILDYSAKVGYFFNVVPMLLDVGVNIGYRGLHLDIDSFSSLHADTDVSGPYAELLIKF